MTITVNGLAGAELQATWTSAPEHRANGMIGREDCKNKIFDDRFRCILVNPRAVIPIPCIGPCFAASYGP